MIVGMSRDNSTPDEGRADRRDDRSRGDRGDGGSRGPKRDADRDSRGGARDGRGGYQGGERKQWQDRGDRGPRRDDDRRGGYQGGERKQWEDRGPRRDDDRRGGYQGGQRKQWEDRGDRGPRQDGERKQWQDRGPRRDDDRRGGYQGGERKQYQDRGDRGPRRDDDRRGGYQGGERKQWEDRKPRQDGDRKQWQDRGDRGPRRDDDRRGGYQGGERRQWEDRGDRGPRRDDDRRPRRDEDRPAPRPGTARRPDEPDTPRDFVEAELPAGVRAELKSLPKDLAETVGAHIWAAGQLVDEDPEMAFRHAEAARRRAGRLPVVREAAAVTAYAAGEFAVALREFRALRRMNGGDELLPVIADCERALGRPRDALEILGELDPKTRDIDLRIECLLVEAGVRDDLGQRAEALRLLKSAIGRQVGRPLAQARLRYAYANLLELEGDEKGAREWFTSSAALDPEGELDNADRVAALDGVVLPESMVIVEEIDEDEDGDILPEDSADEDGDVSPEDEAEDGGDGETLFDLDAPDEEMDR